MFDYTIRCHYRHEPDEPQVIRDVGYQQVVEALGLEDIELHGAKMTEGGTPQAVTLCDLIAEASTLIEFCELYYQGRLIHSNLRMTY